ncbi:MAG: Ni/Fe hydrogenase subunit alpha [Rubrivivax sp.]
MTELETASHPEGLRRVAIDPLTRVEGHGKVTLLLDAHDRVQQARLHIVEFRGFEAFICGRPYWEVPVMVQRLCGICPVSHHLAACKALDAVAGAARVPVSAERLRRLMHHGQVMQSHALHFFHLASPDLLFGFDSDPARRHIVGVAQAHPEIARQGIALRRYGQEVIRATAGKRIHGTGSVPGGVNRLLSDEDHALLRREWPQMLAHALDAVAIAQRLADADAGRHRRFAVVPARQLSLVRPGDGALELYDGVIRVRDAEGRITLDGFDPARYLELIEEEVKPWSYMKFPYLRAFGPDEGWYRVGPLARLQNCSFIDTPRAEAARQAFVARAGGAVVHAALATHQARLIEMLHALEVIGNLLDDPALRAGDLVATGARAREGVGVIEAPRGTLIHHYRVGDDDLVQTCNLIVSTTHNNQAMNEAVRAVARERFDGRALTEGLLNEIEVAIRAYDPCLSCATHALGAMPIELTLCAADGTPLDLLRRDGDGRVTRG